MTMARSREQIKREQEQAAAAKQKKPPQRGIPDPYSRSARDPHGPLPGRPPARTIKGCR
jgi:hypothetical protein